MSDIKKGDDNTNLIIGGAIAGGLVLGLAAWWFCKGGCCKSKCETKDDLAPGASPKRAQTTNPGKGEEKPNPAKRAATTR